MDLLYILLVYGSVLLGILWSVICTLLILKVKVEDSAPESEQEFKAEDFEEENTFVIPNRMAMVESIGRKIEKGAYAFLMQEYCIMSIFVILFSGVVLVAVDFYGTSTEFTPQFYAFVAFIVGSITSMICGFIGMAIAVKANYRTTFLAT